MTCKWNSTSARTTSRVWLEAKRDVSVDAFPDRKYDGVIAEISPEANRQKATVQVKVQILNPDEFLRPEMNASVRFLPKDGEVRGSGVFVPTASVRSDGAKKYVFVVTGNHVDRREVSVAGPRSGASLLRSQGRRHPGHDSPSHLERRQFGQD